MSMSEEMKQRISKMTLEQKLGMLICGRSVQYYDEDAEGIIELIKKRALGCLMLNPKTPEVTEKILKEADYPILVVDDAEQGFRTTELPLLQAYALAACNKKEYYQAFAKGLVRDAKNAKFNSIWGPVIDVLYGDGPCRVSRHYSDDPMKVAKAAEEIIKIFHQNHILATGKHYPGGHDGNVDSHMMESVTELTEQHFKEFDLVPYKYLMEKGLLPAIMSGHIVCKSIDPEHVASLSKKVIDIIRNMGYDGLIFTDSLNMSAVIQKYGEEQLYGMAVAAGNDIILPLFTTSTKGVLEMLKRNYEKGIITDERLNDAVSHVLAAQDFVGQTPENPTEFTPEDEKLLHNVAKECITAITDEGVSTALEDKNKKRLFVVLEEEKMFGDEKGEINFSRWYEPEMIGEKIKQEFPGAEVAYLPALSWKSDHHRMLNLTRENTEVVLVTYSYTTCFLGTDCLTRRTEAILNALIYTGKVSTLVHFGNPYAVKPLLHVPRKIFGYQMTESQNYAIEALSGKIEANGTLPFDIDFQ